MDVLRRAFIAGSISWAVLLPVAPFAASQPAPAPFWYGLAFLMYTAGSFICHQLPARSFHAWAAQWPVCARCTGIYFGSAAAAIVTALGTKPETYDTVRPEPDTTSRSRMLLAAAALPTAATLIFEWTTGVTPSNAIRAIAGAPLGAIVTFVVVKALRTQALR